ncbi:SWR1-complex protein 5 [Drechmeria coniospora]|uniref:SWR1-complex protein 5 n=1 Tax=Drechmeria coniospora TaxID=98403 RepID=A0A151GSF0_DRECN|nr:SWR1-complex protein 5 [Drechmeria coniospora]KYK60044.1 SWR1-complex protein 5 [Drechmeria coniospora]ODA79986.1 hypothetical protein RJ55_02944 [Drechmeria coniospora]
MPHDNLSDDDDEKYASSEDSDFAPEEAPEQASASLDSEADSEGEADDRAVGSTARKRQADGDVDGQDEGYDNSGDEAIIQKGRKRQRKRRDAGVGSDDDAQAHGGLIKTRRQRAEEKAERKVAAIEGKVTVDVDALWEQMVSGNPMIPKSSEESKAPESPNGKRKIPAGNMQDGGVPNEDPSETILIKRTYNFAGQVHTEEKIVGRDSAEAKLYLASHGGQVPLETSPAKRATKKAFRSAFEPIVEVGPGRTDLDLGVAAMAHAAKEAQAKKLNTVEKSRMDWAGYVDKEGIKDELELASKSKESYNARSDFLARSEAIRGEEEKRARVAARA